MSTQWRRHWKIPVGLVVLAATLLLVAGQIRVIAYVGTGGDDTVGSSVNTEVDYTNEIDLFDDSVVHTIALDFDQSDLETFNILSDQFALAIYNAQLYRRARYQSPK